MQVVGIRVLDEAAIENARTLLWCYVGLRMDPEVEGVEIERAFTQTIAKRFQEALDGFCFHAPFYFHNSILLDGQRDRPLEVGGDSDIARPPAESAVENEGPGGFSERDRRAHPFRPGQIIPTLPACGIAERGIPCGHDDTCQISSVRVCQFPFQSRLDVR